MGRDRTTYVCERCGYEAAKWLGQCPSCGEWNCLVETVGQAQRGRSKRTVSPAMPITSISTVRSRRIPTGIGELDRVLGGGMVAGSLVLIGGDPGIGKSTLVLQAADHIARGGRSILYASGEESSGQIKLRADRLGITSGSLHVFAETDLSLLLGQAETLHPESLVVDSIQTIYDPDLPGPQGSVGQVRGCAMRLMEFAKSTDISVVLIGHVTKDGTIAGPKTLEHMVDSVLYLEGDRHHHYRILRTIKNRFGSTNEIGVFEMGQHGLSEVLSPSESFLSERMEGVPGSVVACALEGTRPLLVEIQALACPTSFGMPQRVATGTDVRRLAMLLAVLERRVGLPVGRHDVFCNVAGGLRIDEPACDLAIVTAVASGLRDRPVEGRVVIMGEVGLGGEIRPVAQLFRRLGEAERLGFDGAVVAHSQAKVEKGRTSMAIHGATDVRQALDILLG
jgi:DNA repair protein RadA/Sms